MATPDGDPRAVSSVAPLTLADVPRLHSAGNPRFNESDIMTAVMHSPGAFWVPDTGEFIVVTPWRHRDEILNVQILWSFRHDGALLDAAAESAADAGAAALIMLETGERRRPAFYHRHGFSRIELIRTYEHLEPRVLARGHERGVQEFLQVHPDDSTLHELVEHLDHDAFPWFWWNSASEFRHYLRYPGVELWAGVQQNRLVSYFGFTAYHHWAHLDRIAVAPGDQGAGLGRSALSFAAARMLRHGARRIGLSTQGSNRVSRRLYESMGFRHTRQADYDVFGIVLDEGRVFAPAGTTSELDRGRR